MTGGRLPAVAGLALLVAMPVGASNGMNMIGYGAESVSMGGADLATTASPCSMNINPAGIAQLDRPQLEFGFSPMNPSLEHLDAMGNRATDQLQRYPVPFIGYTQPVRNLTFGVGLFVQGGMGAEYRDLSTPFSAMAGSGQLPPGFFDGDLIPLGDDTKTKIAHAKLTPTIAWRIRPGWTLGASLNVSQVEADMKLFPETSVMADLDGSGTIGDSPADAFFGMQLQNASATGLGFKLGMQYERGALSVAGAYTSKTDLDLDGGTLAMNMTSIGLGKVAYDAKMVDFGWPQQVGIGAAYRFSERVLFAADVDWIDWSDAIDMLAIEIENPNLPMAPPSRRIPFEMGWDNQWVWAVGAAFEPAEDWVVRAGYNHGDTPVPAATLRPLFPAIAEDHLTAGFGVTKRSWTFDLALEYVPETSLINNSNGPTNVFGPGSQESLSQFVAHFFVRRSL